MATYHLSAQGPRPCSATVRDCPVGGDHFGSMAEAMEGYQEKLREQFGDFHVLIRPTTGERVRRAGYSLRDKLEARPAGLEALEALRHMRESARHARKMIQVARSSQLQQNQEPQLPVATSPLEQQVDTPEDQEAVSASQESFEEPLDGKAFLAMLEESSKEHAARSAAMGMPKADTSRADAIHAQSQRAGAALRALENRSSIGKKFGREAATDARAAVGVLRERAARATRAIGFRAQRKLASSVESMAARSSQGLQAVKTRAIEAGNGIHQSYVDASLKATAARKALQARAAEGARTVKLRASRMTVPAGSIRPGDTFGNSRVKSVEDLGDGIRKISYTVGSGGPVLSTKVPADRKMAVDRKTRREARNSRLASQLKSSPISQRLSEVTSATSQQLMAMRSYYHRSDLRFDGFEKAMAREDRLLKQRELIAKLKSTRSLRSSVPAKATSAQPRQSVSV